DAVGGAVVLAREDAAAGVGSQDRRVVAYVTPAATGSADTLDLEALRQLTVERLPDYMVPAAFVALDTFPLNANGKVDRRALPAPEYRRAEGREPETDTELRIAEIWGELLPVERVGADDDFFILGGHSLLATQLASRLRKTFGIQVGLGQIFECATVARQAELIDGSTPTTTGASPIRNAEAAELVDQAASMAEADLDALLGEMLDENQGLP
ncbi:MAG: phosphopantetheine-binding protein, partial [Acidobacteriota bacterium]